MRYEYQQRIKEEAAQIRVENRMKVLRYRDRNPDLSYAEIGGYFGRTGAWVSWILKEVLPTREGMNRTPPVN